MKSLVRALALALVVAQLGCPGDGSDGAAPLLRFFSTPDCRVIAGGFPSGVVRLTGRDDALAVVQFAPPAVLSVDLDFEPPRLLAPAPVPAEQTAKDEPPAPPAPVAEPTAPVAPAAPVLVEEKY